MRPLITKTRLSLVRREEPVPETTQPDNRPPLEALTSIFGSRQMRGYSLAIWFLLLAWLARITIFIRPRAASEFSSVDVFAGIQILFVVAIFFLTIISGRAVIIWSRTSGTSVRMFYYYYFFCALSMVWSPQPTYSLYRAGEFIVLLSGAFIALSYAKNFLKAERVVLVVSLVTIILGVYPHLKLYHFTLTLERLHSTTYPAAGAMVFVYCLGEYFSSDKARRKILLMAGSLGFVALITGTSTGSLVSVILGIMVIAFFNRNMVWIVTGSFLLLLVFIFSYIFPIDIGMVEDIALQGKSEHRIMTLSGRIPMWTRFMSAVFESPVYGHGFALLSSGSGNTFAVNPHNSILAILLGTGFIGLSIVLVYFFRLLIEALATIPGKTPGALGCSAAIFTGIVNSITAPAIFSIWKMPTLVFASFNAFFILFVIIPYRMQKKSRSARAVRHITGQPAPPS